jgi:hypothetical protein
MCAFRALGAPAFAFLRKRHLACLADCGSLPHGTDTAATVSHPEQTAALSIADASSCVLSNSAKGSVMKKIFALSAVAGLVALSACNNTPREQAADNIEANADAVADNYEAAADNATTEAGEHALDNKADAVRAEGDNKAEDMRTHDADTNLANGM